MKAVFQKAGMDAWGHTLTALMDRLPQSMKASETLIDVAKVLDKHCIPTRYPNGFDSGAPTDFYTEQEAQEAVKYAEEIVEFCRDQIG